MQAHDNGSFRSMHLGQSNGGSSLCWSTYTVPFVLAGALTPNLDGISVMMSSGSLPQPLFKGQERCFSVCDLVGAQIRH